MTARPLSLQGARAREARPLAMVARLLVQAATDEGADALAAVGAYVLALNCGVRSARDLHRLTGAPLSTCKRRWQALRAVLDASTLSPVERPRVTEGRATGRSEPRQSAASVDAEGPRGGPICGPVGSCSGGPAHGPGGPQVGPRGPISGPGTLRGGGNLRFPSEAAAEMQVLTGGDGPDVGPQPPTTPPTRCAPKKTRGAAAGALKRAGVKPQSRRWRRAMADLDRAWREDGQTWKDHGAMGTRLAAAWLQEGAMVARTRAAAPATSCRACGSDLTHGVCLADGCPQWGARQSAADE